MDTHPSSGSLPGGPSAPASPPPFPRASRPVVPVSPGRAWYLVALGLFAGGVTWLVVSVLALAGQVSSFQRVPLPAGGEITLPHGGGYVIYYEAHGASSGTVPSFDVRVAPRSPGAAALTPQPYHSLVTYGFGHHHGRAVLTLRVSRPGRYLVEPRGAPTVAGGSDLAVGGSVTGAIVRILLPSLPLILLACLSALVLFVIRAVLISRARKQVP